MLGVRPAWSPGEPGGAVGSSQVFPHFTVPCLKRARLHPTAAPLRGKLVPSAPGNLLEAFCWWFSALCFFRGVFGFGSGGRRRLGVLQGSAASIQDLGILGRRPTGREEHRAGGRPEREGGWLPLRFRRGVLGALEASICGHQRTPRDAPRGVRLPVFWELSWGAARGPQKRPLADMGEGQPEKEGAQGSDSSHPGHSSLLLIPLLLPGPRGTSVANAQFRGALCIKSGQMSPSPLSTEGCLSLVGPLTTEPPVIHLPDGPRGPVRPSLVGTRRGRRPVPVEEGFAEATPPEGVTAALARGPGGWLRQVHPSAADPGPHP